MKLKRSAILWVSNITFWAFLAWAGERHRWIEYCRCYFLVVGCPCCAVAIAADKGLNWKPQSRLYQFGFIVALIGLVSASPVYFLRILALAGAANVMPLSGVGVAVSTGLLLTGWALSYIAWRFSQRKYRREYEEWHRLRDEWERQNPDWEREQRIHEWNFGRPVSEDAPSPK